jgi:RimJ/RimL family protein N-acetyltransferase
MIQTERLQLLPATPARLRSALEGRRALALELSAEVPDSWPPGYPDPQTLRETMDGMADAATPTFWGYYFILLPRLLRRRVLIGTVGYLGPPDDRGTVRIRCAIVPEYRGKGHLAGAQRALCTRALLQPGVTGVTCHAAPPLEEAMLERRAGWIRFDGEGTRQLEVRFP